MGETLSLVSLIVGLALSIISLISFIFIKPFKGREEKAKLAAKQEWEAEQERRRQDEENARIVHEKKKLEQMRLVVKEELQPLVEAVRNINQRLEKIEEDDQVQKEALLAEASNSLHALNKECLKKKYADQYERIAFNRLYESYRKLGGNHEMEAVSKKFLSLPESKPEKNK